MPLSTNLSPLSVKSIVFAMALTSSNFFAVRVPTIIKSGLSSFKASRFGSKIVPTFLADAKVGFKYGRSFSTSAAPSTFTPKACKVSKLPVSNTAIFAGGALNVTSPRAVGIVTSFANADVAIAIQVSVNNAFFNIISLLGICD